MIEPIRFLLNGAPVEITDLPPTTTLLNWLRYERRLTGTSAERSSSLAPCRLTAR